MKKFKGKYRIQSNRMPGWDYAGNGRYFITICENHRNCIFGNIKNGEMVLNDFGKIVNHEWIISAQIRQEIELDEFVVMPNHIHGIVIVTKIKSGQPPPQSPPTQSLHRKPKSLSSFIAGYKSAVTSKINEIIIKKHGSASASKKIHTRKNRLWQVNYHDSIIRYDGELQRIRQYIKNNPANWDNDTKNP